MLAQLKCEYVVQVIWSQMILDNCYYLFCFCSSEFSAGSWTHPLKEVSPFLLFVSASSCCYLVFLSPSFPPLFIFIHLQTQFNASVRSRYYMIGFYVEKTLIITFGFIYNWKSSWWEKNCYTTSTVILISNSRGAKLKCRNSSCMSHHGLRELTPLHFTKVNLFSSFFLWAIQPRADQTCCQALLKNCIWHQVG